MRATTKLRQALKNGMVVAPGCFDPFSARLAELAGFEAIHMTGGGVEATQLCAPDLGLLTMTEVVHHVGRMANAVDIPIIADIDTGFGGVLSVQRTIREMERAGVGGVHLEDQTLPKHCPLLGGRTVVSRGQAVDRLKAALDARTDADFVIIARTDSDTISYNEMVDRLNLFLETGADVAMPVPLSMEGGPSKLTPDGQMEFYRKMLKDINGPVMKEGFGPPEGYTEQDLAELGFAIVIYGAQPLGVAANALSALFRDLKEKRTDRHFISANPGPYHDPLMWMRVAHLDEYVEIEKRYPQSL